MRLFRYLDTAGAIATIEQKTLRVSRLHDLNDPFEWRVGVSDLVDGVQHLVEAAVEAAIRDLSSTIGVICFSSVADESVLWSHYADRHRGIVLECEVTDDPQKLVQIIYTDQRPHFRAGMIGDHDHMLPQINTMIRQKSPGWAYEQEFRLYESLPLCDSRGGAYFKALDNGVLKRVILGWRCAADTNYIERAIALSGYTDVRVTRAELQSASYKIKC